MFSISVQRSFYLKNINIVIISGKVQGSLKNGEILVDKDDVKEKYMTKGIAFVDGRDNSTISDSLDIQLEPGDYSAQQCLTPGRRWDNNG